MENEGIYLQTFGYLTTITNHTDTDPKAKGSIPKST